MAAGAAIQLQELPVRGGGELTMKKGDQLCILRADVTTDADALNLLRLVAALTALGSGKNLFALHPF